MKRLIYLLPERYRRNFRFYRKKLAPLWFYAEKAPVGGRPTKRWHPYGEIVRGHEFAFVAIISIEIHNEGLEKVKLSGTNPVFDNLVFTTT